MRTRIEVGVPKFRARPPTVVRPPTEPRQATLSDDFECTEDPFNTGGDDLITIPAGQPGDLGIIFAAIWGSQTITGITGWTQLATSSSDTGTGYVFYRVYDGTESTTVAGTHSGDGRSNAIAIRLNANGVDFTSSPPEATMVGGIAGTPNPPSHTPSTGAGTYFVFAGANAAYPTFLNYDMISGYTDLGGCEDGSTASRLGWSLIDIDPAEDPPAFPGSDIGARHWNAWTVAVLQQPSPAPVSGPGHTHTESEIEDLSHTVAEIDVKKSGTLVGTRGGINFIPGTDISLTVTDDAANDEVDVTITSTGGGGGGGGGSNAAYKHANYPGTADAFDEEFDTDPTAGWTWLNQSTASVSVANSVLSMSDSRNTNNCSFIGVAPPSAQDYTIETFQYPWRADAGINRSGGYLAVRHGTTITAVGFYLLTHVRTLQYGSNGSGSVASHSTAYPAELVGPHYLRAVWDNTAGTLDFEVSYGGGEWFTVHSYTPGSTPDLIGFAGHFEMNRNIIYSWEYLRRTA